jgi:3-hydroxyacyl-[acyl-carrier-protein] dehydratase
VFIGGQKMSLESIKRAIPHREPFLLIDEIVEQTENHIVCRKRFSGDEFWYPGHYPRFALTPGVLLLESAMQAGAVLLAKQVEDNPDKVPVVSRINNVKFKMIVRPGDTIVLDVTLTEQLSGAFYMDASVLLDGKAAVTFEFTCKLASKL